MARIGLSPMRLHMVDGAVSAHATFEHSTWSSTWKRVRTQHVDDVEMKVVSNMILEYMILEYRWERTPWVSM